MSAIISAISGFASGEASEFIDWDEVATTNANSLDVADVMLKRDISRICQLSPYAFALSPQHPELEAALSSAGVLPVPEGEFLFAYFNNESKLLGFDTLPAHKGKLRASNQGDEDFTCLLTKDARFAIAKSEDHVSVSLLEK